MKSTPDIEELLDLIPEPDLTLKEADVRAKVARMMRSPAIPDEDRAHFQQALLDTYEPGKRSSDWLLDAALWSMSEAALLPAPPPNSPMAILVATNRVRQRLWDQHRGQSTIARATR